MQVLVEKIKELKEQRSQWTRAINETFKEMATQCKFKGKRLTLSIKIYRCKNKKTPSPMPLCQISSCPLLYQQHKEGSETECMKEKTF